MKRSREKDVKDMKEGNQGKQAEGRKRNGNWVDGKIPEERRKEFKILENCLTCLIHLQKTLNSFVIFVMIFKSCNQNFISEVYFNF